MERGKLSRGAEVSAGTGGGEWRLGMTQLILEGTCSMLHILRTLWALIHIIFKASSAVINTHNPPLFSDTT